ncbi:MAG: hydantoinase B/oxoprolinase family protein [Betaproteobacteria bacterium]|nr:hydantoinase B/oxoprolinase family protein [Betaproteobacteria bacterium]
MKPSRNNALNAFRLEIVSHALNAITEEIQLTLLRSAYSHVVKEAQDASCAIFTAAGRIVTQPVVIPGQLGSMRFMLLEVLKAFPPATMRPGDVYILNDPYRGGSHLPDIAVFRPIFYKDRLFAFAGCIIHYSDVGGMVPGSNPMNASEIYQEGLVIPPLKLCEDGDENTTLIEIIRANVRVPDIFMGDLRAQEGALLKGEQRLHDLLDRYGFDGVMKAMELLIEYSEKKAREAIKAIPNGFYEFTDYMDHDGVDLSKPVKIHVRLEVQDERLCFDFTGTDAQVKGPLNAPLSKVWTTIFYCVRCVLPDDIPFNDGLTRVVEVHVPEGTLLNPRHPAAVNARSVTVNRVADAALGALALAVPKHIGAQSCGVPTGVSFGGVHPQTGRNFVFYESYCGGMGGSHTTDGADGVSTGSSNAMNIPVESIEIDYPIRMVRYELVPDSGGSGKFRGGLGLLREYEMLAENATVSVRGDRAQFAPRGLYQGGEGSFSSFFIQRAGGRLEKIPSKFSGRVQRGERLRVTTPGGGGFGNASERDRAALVRDFLDGKITAEKTKTDYGIDIRAEAQALNRPKPSKVTR